MCCGLLLAGQANDEFSELALTAVDFDCATMLLADDVIADRQAEPGAFTSRLARDKGLEQFVPDLRRDAAAVVAHPNFNSVAEIAGRYSQRRPKVRAGAVALPFGSRIKAVAKQVEKHPGHFLRRQLGRCETAVKVALQNDVAARLCPRSRTARAGAAGNGPGVSQPV